MQGAIEDPETVEKAFAGVEAIVHLAWSFSRLIPSFLSTLSAQKIRGTRVLLK